MVRGTFADLKELREKLLGYRFESVVRLTGLAPERLRAIETGADPTVYEVERLAEVYGVDEEKLGEVPIELSPGDGVQVLASLAEFREIDDVTRARIVGAANAAREFVRLLRMESEDDPRNRFRKELGAVPGPNRRFAPFRQGGMLATWVRRRWKLGSRPIRSLRDLVEQSLPAIGLLYADLGSNGPAGLTFADALRGPTIVLNLRGKNTNPSVRRFSLAHELCHLLVDWTHEPLAVISGYLTESSLEREQRANAFAVRLLCPESVLDRIGRKRSDVEAARDLYRYGLHYSAIRLYLRKQANVELPPTPPPELAAIGTEAVWAQAEEPAGIRGFPLDDVPSERRTVVARTAARLYSAGRIPRDAFADALGVTPGHEVERVLDYFGLDTPSGVSYALA